MDLHEAVQRALARHGARLLANLHAADRADVLRAVRPRLAQPCPTQDASSDSRRISKMITYGKSIYSNPEIINYGQFFCVCVCVEHR